MRDAGPFIFKFTVFDYLGNPNRIVRYDNIAQEGIVLYLDTRNDPLAIIDPLDPTYLRGDHDLISYLHNWLKLENSTIKQGWPDNITITDEEIDAHA